MAARQLPFNKKEREFIAAVWKHYRKEGRHDLPWRKTADPYRILISELMLQQTQVSRVVPKYTAFLKRFPTIRILATAPLGDVLKAWQGLGYNRRAKFLWQTAQIILNEYKGKWPVTYGELKTLPGIGTYTAGAVMNFAYNSPIPLIETNIRTVYIHHFFSEASGVQDTELFSIIEKTLDTKNPREWNWALMDYGAHLKATVGNLNVRSQGYKKQSPFKESNRFVRGQIIRALAKSSLTKKALATQLNTIEPSRIELLLEKLLEEALIEKNKMRYSLPE